jgi:hypothetical protein
MTPLINLIEKYKNTLSYSTYEIWCNKSNNTNRYKDYDTDSVLKNFLSITTGHPADDLPWEFRNPKGLWLNYSVSNKENEIMLGDRRIAFDVSKNFRTVKHVEKKRFLFWKYEDVTTEQIETEKSKEQLKPYKEKGFKIYEKDTFYRLEKKVYAITFRNILYEIDKDTFDELEQFTLMAIKNRSIKSITTIK